MERYAFGWTDPRVAVLAAEPEPVYTIRWYHRVLWRMWRWGIWMLERL